MAIRFQRPELPDADAIERYFAASRERRWFSNGGPCHELLVERLGATVGGGSHCVPLSSGTLALMCGLRALAGEPAGDRREVLVPSFTFAATASAVVWAGFEPVLLDIETGSWHVSGDALQSALDQRAGSVAAVLACSTFGTPAPRALTERWEAAARGAGVPLLVDSAAGFGATDERGAALGCQGDAEVFSMHATKPLAIGEGAILSTCDAAVAEAVASVANFGFGPEREPAGPLGLNAKLDEWHCATALAALDRLPGVLDARRERAERLRESLEPHGFIFQEGSERSPWQFVPVLAPSAETRARAIDVAAERGIELRTYFDPPLHRLAPLAGAPVHGTLTATDDVCSRILSLPMANDLSPEELDAVGGALAAAVTGPAPVGGAR
jgi:dTDP-4-amino-4,6-dideoxygalactose transaminase